jgi:hypothetical protein
MKNILKTLLLLVGISVFVSCIKDMEKDGFNVTLQNTDSYTYKYLNHVVWQEWDEEEWNIKVQAQHYEISEIVRADSIDMKWKYCYKPKAGYVGKDYVVLEIYKRMPDGGIHLQTQRINFKVKKHYPIRPNE